MNKILKAKIIEKYGSQADFAQAIKTDETIISRIIRGRRTLDSETQHTWARVLGCNAEDIFNESI
jgi:plasmid maintenance system antidote protein VapI